MASIEEVLNSLDPPLKHRFEKQGGNLLLILEDTVVKKKVARCFTPSELKNSVSFQIVLLYAINEIRGMGSHVTLQVLPMVDPPAID